MHYMILIYSNEQDWEKLGDAEANKMLGDFNQYTADLTSAGILRGSSRLTPVGSATTVRIRDGKTLTTDGPFAETKEQLGGYYLIEVEHLDEALKWAAKCPAARLGSIELRALWEMSGG